MAFLQPLCIFESLDMTSCSTTTYRLGSDRQPPCATLPSPAVPPSSAIKPQTLKWQVWPSDGFTQTGRRR